MVGAGGAAAVAGNTAGNAVGAQTTSPAAGGIRSIEMIEDVKLVRRTLGGDQQAFAGLVEKYKDSVFNVAYRMYWTDDIPVAWSGARAVQTRTGNAKAEGSKFFVVDFGGPAVAGQRQLPVAAVTANPGTVSNVIVHPNPEIDGVRVSFELNPAGTDLCELRLALMLGDRQISETWLYRWTRS